MARAGELVVVKPANNVYTVMVIVGTVVQILTLAIIVLRIGFLFLKCRPRLAVSDLQSLTCRLVCKPLQRELVQQRINV